MAHDVFLSYRRPDLALCDEVLQRIRRIGYIPYRDVDDLGGGQPWRDQLREALSRPDLKPYVVVLCTRAAVEKPERILEEIRLARENDLAVIPIEFEPGAVKSIFNAAGYKDSGRIHYIDAADPSGRYVVGDRLEDDLRRSLTRRVQAWLDHCRILAKEWSDRLTPKVSFWETAWRDYFPSGSHGWPGSAVLTARGGSGKSFLIARCVRHLLEDPEICPVLIDEAMLRDTARFSRDLGARSAAELPRQVEALGTRPFGDHQAWKPMQIVFVVDGLDQMVIPGDVQQTELVRGLNLLVNSATVLIGCHEEVWNAWYAGRVSVTEQEVPELNERQVRNLLKSKGLADWFNALLQVPFFLDIALQKSSVWPSLPKTETDFLRQIWDDAVCEGALGSLALPGDTDRAWILETLARCQLEQLAYDVPFRTLSAQPGYLPEYLAGLRELKATGLLIEQPRIGSTLRMRHDLLDNYSMVRLLFRGDRLKNGRDLCRRCEKDCGWSLLASLVQAAHDWGDEELKRELFTEFLYILDHKRLGNEAMVRAWAVVYVLKTCFHPLFDLIVRALAGEPVPSLDGRDPAQTELRPSSLEPSRLTQEAASTLASAFTALQTGTVEAAAKAVPVLARGLQRWPLKGRFLEALAKYRTDEARDAIVSFGRSALRDKKDLGSLLYVAQRLRHFPCGESYALLGEIFSDRDLDSTLRRVAAEVLNDLLPGLAVDPAIGDDEIINRLRVREVNGLYTDWRVLKDCAVQVSHRMARGESFGLQVLQALIKALEHDQKFVRGAVAQALAMFDEKEARDALLSEVLEPALPAEVRSACLNALKLQLRRLTEPRIRQKFRYLLLRAASVARHVGAVTTERELTNLALDLELRHQTDWPLTEQALEVVPPGDIPWMARCSIATAEIDPMIIGEVGPSGHENVGSNHKPEYRFASLDVIGGSLAIKLAPTSWELGRNFQSALNSYPERFLRDDSGRWLEPVPLGDTRLPGLAVVHVIVLTADGFVLAAQRARSLSNAPEHWSISFEEQVTELDVREGDRAFHHAAYRGLIEKFGITVDPSLIHLLSAWLEVCNLNLAFVVLIHATRTLAEIRRSWSSEPLPSHAWEVQALDGIEADPAALEEVAGGAPLRLEPLYPTSRLRCAVLARWLARENLTRSRSQARGGVAAGRRIFLSYAREDQAQVERLYLALQNAGFEPWMDTEDILPGQAFRRVLRKAVQDADFFLACVSVHSVRKRGFVRREIRQALDLLKEKLEDDIYLIPVRFDDCDVPESLSGFQWVDLFGDYDEALQRLLRALHKGTGDLPVEARSPSPRPGEPSALIMARRTLEILDVQAAAHTSLTMPARLQIELEDKRREVADLERRWRED